jgi:hypothetical protein
MKHRPMLWTSKDEAILRQGAIDGGSMAAIARKMGRFIFMENTGVLVRASSGISSVDGLGGKKRLP